METLKYCSSADLRSSELDPSIVTEDPVFREAMDRRQRERNSARMSVKAIAVPKNVKKSPQRRARKSPEISWLKGLICPFVYGEKTPDGIFPSVTKQTFVGRWNLSMGLPSLPNYKLLDHFQGKETLYFFGNGSEQCKNTLVMIDIDVLKSKGLGSPAGAIALSTHLISIWPDMYFEPSTNGKGMHGYFILRKSGVDAQRTNASLKRLERWLRSESLRINADIEQVEVKGACLDITFEGRLVQSVQYGSFAKLPREISRFDEWGNTTVLRVQDLETSVFDEGAAFRVDSKASVPVLKMSVSNETISQPRPTVTVKVKAAPAVSSSGSVSGRVINEEELSSSTVR